jgi:hypothetical protein
VAILKMPDDLDLPARRVRGSVARLFKRLRAANNFSLDAAQQQLEGWFASSEVG